MSKYKIHICLLCMVKKFICIIKTNYLMLFREIGLIDNCSMNRTKHIYRTCVEKGRFFRCYNR